MNEPDSTFPAGEPNPAISTPAGKSAWDTTKDKANEALHTGEVYVRENPGTSVLSIFGLGVVVGFLVGWSMAHEERHDTNWGLRWH